MKATAQAQALNTVSSPLRPAMIGALRRECESGAKPCMSAVPVEHQRERFGLQSGSASQGVSPAFSTTPGHNFSQVRVLDKPLEVAGGITSKPSPSLQPRLVDAGQQAAAGDVEVEADDTAGASASPGASASTGTGAAAGAGASAGATAAAAPTASAGAGASGSTEKCDENSRTAYKGITEFNSTMPTQLGGGDFNPAKEFLEKGPEAHFAYHVPILNGQILPPEAAATASQINGVEQGNKKGVVIVGTGNSRRAYFDPATQPEANEAESLIVLPNFGGTGWSVKASGTDVVNLIRTLPENVPVEESGGTENDCLQASDVTFKVDSASLDPSQIEGVIRKHEEKHASDWNKAFCRTIGARDARVANRTGPENARTGFALSDGQKAQDRALRKLFWLIPDKTETATKCHNRREYLASVLHSRHRLNFQYSKVVIGPQCKGVLVNYEFTPRGGEAVSLHGFGGKVDV